MKVLVNSGLNLSELDGWWAEAYAPEVGWALGDGREHGDDAAWDAAEADTLYAFLEGQIVPAFYERDVRGIPVAWIARMRESMAGLTPRFSTNRVLREYTERYYLPAAVRYRRRAADKAVLGAQLIRWRQNLAEHWHEACFGTVHVTTSEGRHSFAVEVYTVSVPAHGRLATIRPGSFRHTRRVSCRSKQHRSCGSAETGIPVQPKRPTSASSRQRCGRQYGC